MNLTLIIIGFVTPVCVLYVKATYKRPPEDIIREINEDKRKHNPHWWMDL